MENKPFYIKYLERYVESPISDEISLRIMNSFREDSYSKKIIIFNEGDPNTRHYFIEKGLLRLYLIDSKGKEINILFARENQIIGDLRTPEPTSFYLETIEESVVHSIEEIRFQELLKEIDILKSVGFNNFMRRSYIHIQNRLVSILSKSAEENYLDFKTDYPDLIQRIPQYLIAGYLGISPEFLSKLIAKTTKEI